MKTFIVTLFFILLFVCGYITDDAVVKFSHIANGFFMSVIGGTFVYTICGMFDGGKFLFPWVAGILDVLLIFDVYIFLFLK